jgi:hypothetical protein
MLPQGRGVRCAGFSLDSVAYCTREEHGGPLPLDAAVVPPAFKHRLVGDCGCGRQHGSASLDYSPRPATRRPTQPEQGLPVETRDAIYRHALGMLPLRDEALLNLRARGLTDEAIEAALYRSIPRKGLEAQTLISAMKDWAGEALLRACPGFTDKNDRLTFWSAVGDTDGFVIPYLDEHRRITGLQKRNLHTTPKYVTARHAIAGDLYHVAGTPQRDLWITEGGLKAEVSSRRHGIWTFGIPGQSLQEGHIDALRRLGPGRVIVALDREKNTFTDRMREKTLDALWLAGFQVLDAIWEGAA